MSPIFFIYRFILFFLSCIKYLFWTFLCSITKVKFSTKIETDCSKMYSPKEKKNRYGKRVEVLESKANNSLLPRLHVNMAWPTKNVKGYSYI